MAQIPGDPFRADDQAVIAPGGRPASGLRALVVEDEVALATLLGSYFQRGGFEVQVVHDGPTAVRVAREVDPDMIVLDLGLPSLDGIEVCRQIRTFSDAYLIMLTARADEIDKLIGLSVGADDYLTKPFSPRELMARVEAMLRRPRPLGQRQPTGRTDARHTSALPADALHADAKHTGAEHTGVKHTDTRSFGSLTIDVVGRDVWLHGATVPLTRTEFDLLATLSAAPLMAFSRRQLIDAVWGPEWVSDEHLVDVHIGHLRRKLDDDAAESKFVRTIRGVGYRMGTGR